MRCGLTATILLRSGFPLKFTYISLLEIDIQLYFELFLRHLLHCISGDSFVRFGTLVGSVRSRVSANGAFLRANRFPITTHSADIEFKVLSTARLGILSEM